MIQVQTLFNDGDHHVSGDSVPYLCLYRVFCRSKVGIATTLKGNLIVGARSFPGNPYDGHTLNEQLEQASILMQASGMKPETIYVDLGYLGVDHVNPGIDIKHPGKFKSLTERDSVVRDYSADKPIQQLAA